MQRPTAKYQVEIGESCGRGVKIIEQAGGVKNNTIKTYIGNKHGTIGSYRD